MANEGKSVRKIKGPVRRYCDEMEDIHSLEADLRER